MNLASELAHYTGTEQWYRHALNRSVTYTDGVRHFADAAGAHWFLDILATEIPPFAKREGFLAIKMVVAKSKAKIAADDGNGKVLWKRAIRFTDCPEGEWMFFMAPGGPQGTIVIMLPSEW
jgi:hypothetical protein